MMARITKEQRAEMCRWLCNRSTCASLRLPGTPCAGCDIASALDALDGADRTIASREHERNGLGKRNHALALRQGELASALGAAIARIEQLETSLRPEVWAFARAMQAAIGWYTRPTAAHALRCCRARVEDLAEGVGRQDLRLTWHTSLLDEATRFAVEAMRSSLLEDAARVAHEAMLVAIVCGALPLDESPDFEAPGSASPPNVASAQCGSTSDRGDRCVFGEGHSLDYHSSASHQWFAGVCDVCGEEPNVDRVWSEVEVCRRCLAAVECERDSLRTQLAAAEQCAVEGKADRASDGRVIETYERLHLLFAICAELRDRYRPGQVVLIEAEPRIDRLYALMHEQLSCLPRPDKVDDVIAREKARNDARRAAPGTGTKT